MFNQGSSAVWSTRAIEARDISTGVDPNRIIIVHGPTGVGKTEFVDALACMYPIEIINMDMGQCYLPLSIGTAKPDWQNSPTPQHLFDLFKEPTYGSVSTYRKLALEKISSIQAAGNIPVLVGGSSFYLKSLFFPPCEPVNQQVMADTGYPSDANLWQTLNAIDQKRARSIHPHDTYRIRRALAIWYSTGLPPSSFEPPFVAPAGMVSLFYLTRTTADLYNRINQRVLQMVDAGWLDEVRGLVGSAWHEFLLKKNILGYPELFAYLAGTADKERTIELIQQKTRNYAKRQQTFWRSLAAQLADNYAGVNNAHCGYECTTINLTDMPSHLYIDQLLDTRDTLKVV